MNKEKLGIASVASKTLLFFVALLLGAGLKAQDSTTVADAAENAPVVQKKSYVRNTFNSRYIIDNQTVMVNIKGTLEFDIQHNFGTVNNGIKDLFGLFSSANMRLGFNYVPVNNLEIGFGANNYNMVVDGSLKYAILKQTTDNKMPLSLTYYGNMCMDTRVKKDAILVQKTADRFAYFNQILIARKFTKSLSIQAGGDFTYWNNVQGYKDDAGNVQPQMENAQFAFSVSGRYIISPQISQNAIVINYEQPVTQNNMNNPRPNLSIGFDMKTSGHDFQIFAGTYSYTLPQYNRAFNSNDFTKGEFVIGFNITRLWNF